MVINTNTIGVVIFRDPYAYGNSFEDGHRACKGFIRDADAELIQHPCSCTARVRTDHQTQFDHTQRQTRLVCVYTGTLTQRLLRRVEMRTLVATIVAAASITCVRAQYSYVEIGSGCCRTSDNQQGTNVDTFIVTSVDECAAACSGGAFTPTAPCAPIPCARERRDGCDVHILCGIHECVLRCFAVHGGECGHNDNDIRAPLTISLLHTCICKYRYGI